MSVLRIEGPQISGNYNLKIKNSQDKQTSEQKELDFHNERFLFLLHAAPK